MEAHLNIAYDKAFAVVVSLTGNQRDADRQMLHAMAYGSYASRAYFIKFWEVSGMFSIVSGD